MAGVTGRELKAAYARSSTWGVAASVTRQILITGTEGWDAQPQIVDDPSINQTFLLPGEVADWTPAAPTLSLQARYEDIDCLLAGAMGSVATPVSISGFFNNSLVAYRHVVTMATELTHFYSLAVDMGNQYVTEIPTAKLSGYTLRVGENGRMQIEFQAIGNKSVYDSLTNTNSTLADARAATLGNRLFRKNGRFRMNIQSAGALGASDEQTIVREITLGGSRQLAADDFVFNQDYIVEPEENGFPELPLEITFARMTSRSANSLARGLATAQVFKADWQFTGPLINSTTARSFLWEMPALQLRSFKAVASGPDQVRPMATFHLKQAAAAPTGMTVTLPMQLTIVNANSQNLLA